MVRRHIVLLVFPGAQSLDISGPIEVFSTAARVLASERRLVGAYAMEILSSRKGTVRLSSGMSLGAIRSVRGYRRNPDTLIVVGGEGIDDALEDPALLSGLRRVAPRARRVASVCTGAFLLAEVGLLDGKRATTHWRRARELACRYPRVHVEDDCIFVRDGALYTSAGVTAGIDMALSMVEGDWGRDVALAVARRLVVFLRRPGGQAQFSAILAAQAAQRRPLRDLQTWVLENAGGDLSVAALARRVHMSPRHFSRVFAAETGQTPSRFVECVRIEAARRRLEDTADGVEQIARECGFGTGESMRRAFLRVLRVSPAEYRRRFSSAAN